MRPSADALALAVGDRFGSERLADAEVVRMLAITAQHLDLVAAVSIDPTDGGADGG